MQKTLILILVCLSSFFLTGCFELLEVVNLNEKGGGSAKMVLNMSRSKAIVKEYMQRDSVQGVKVPTPKSIVDGLEYAKEMLQKTDGIHNADYSVDLESYIVTFKADFDSVQALNNAYNVLLQKKPVLKDLFVYTYNDDNFSRDINETVLSKVSAYYTMLTLYGVQEAKFTTIVRSENEIKSASGNAKVSKTGKSLMEVKSIKELINKQSTQLKLNFR